VDPRLRAGGGGTYRERRSTASEARVHDILTLVSGIAWTIVYLTCIRRGFREKTYCMPSAALALNFSWECVYAVHGLSGPLTLQTIVDVVWALADVVIIVTFLLYGRYEFPGDLSRVWFVAWAVVLGGLSFTVQVLFVDQFGFHTASRYSAFLMNVVMSVLFLAFAINRGSDRGQSWVIAVARGVGTMAATGVFGVLEHSSFVLGLGIACAVLDALYLVVVLQQRSARGGTGAARSPRRPVAGAAR
jgi:hypothetical protein